MNAEKILGLLAIALSVVGGFVVIPYAGLALVVIGLALGVIIDREGSLRIMASAIVLAGAASHSLDAIPVVGAQLSGIIGGLAAMSAGASITLIARAQQERGQGQQLVAIRLARCQRHRPSATRRHISQVVVAPCRRAAR